MTQFISPYLKKAGIHFVFFCITSILFCSVGQACFAKDKPVTWDQKEAIRRVKAIIAQEESGVFAWEKIDWLTDPTEAVRLAQEQNKPIFLFFFLKGDVGPKESPC